MAFGSIVIGALTFLGIGPGQYMRSDVAFGTPASVLKLSPGKRANAKAPTSFSITRQLEKDFVPVGSTIPVRRSLTVTLQVNMPDEFPMADVDNLIGQISELATPEFLNRLALGES